MASPEMLHAMVKGYRAKKKKKVMPKVNKFTSALKKSNV